jgi:hypothetical protein
MPWKQNPRTAVEVVAVAVAVAVVVVRVWELVWALA